MKKALVISTALALMGCASEGKRDTLPSVLEGVEEAKSISKLESIISNCREEYNEFFLQEVCVHNERGKHDGEHYIPEVKGFAFEASLQNYTSTDIQVYDRYIFTLISKHKDRCLKVHNKIDSSVEFKCYEYALHKILLDVEASLNLEPSDEIDRTRNLFMYFYVLDIWLNAI